MSIFSRLKNLIPAETETASLEEDKLLEWLGIDREKPEAIQETTYYTCLKVLSETMGKMPLKYYKTNPEGGRVREPPNDVGRLLMIRPNPVMSPSTFWTTMEANCQHFGNSYAWIQRKYIKNGRYGGKYVAQSIWPMQSDCVSVVMDDVGVFGNAGELYYNYTDPKTGKLYPFRQDDVIHIKNWLTWDGIMGKSVQDVLADTIGGAGYSQKYLEQLYQTGLTASSVLQYTGDLDEKLRKRLQKEYNSLLTGAQNAGKVVPLPIGMTLTPLNYKLSDVQFIDLKKYSALQIAAAFGVKPNQINDYEKSSYANSEMQQLAFLVDTMLYRITQYEQEINYKCQTQKEALDGYFYKFNEKVILRTDAEAQMRTLTSGVEHGIYKPNEARELLDLPPDPYGDVLIVNGNFVKMEDVGAAYGKEDSGNDL